MILWVVFGVGVMAGFVDAIAGGGGLIMLPGLLFTGLPVGSAIATNKLCGTFGALTSSLKFAFSGQIDWLACLSMGLPAVIGAALGSRSIDRLPASWAEPIVIALMVAITLFVVANPNLGMPPVPVEGALGKKSTASRSWWRIAVGLLAGFMIGFHDGFFGPGTGVFLVFVLLSLWSLDFLKGTGTTKVINLMTNLTALVTFAASGNIDYTKGVAGAFGVGLGAYVGATFATKRGAQLIKPLFVIVTTALIIKLLADAVS